MISKDQDPALEECPDFASDEYREARVEFMEGTITEIQVTQILKVWSIESSRWNRRAEEEAVEQVIANTRRAEEATRMLAQEEADREEVRREDRKKNLSKYVPIPKRPPPTLCPEIVAPYAQRRIDKGLYCKMYYFMVEGLDAAKKVGAYVDESMVPVTDGAGSMAWIPAIVKRDLGSFKEDQNLTWEEFSGAIPCMLLAMQRASWPADRIKALARFWGSLLSHPSGSPSTH
ncbi:hypothetical protein M422DRAFT_160302 [Sphaerobolus stellatus SS14]|nr:hypothetical protein M422DRAFT_160302 [Sphaerobolus stellatus SS14]